MGDSLMTASTFEDDFEDLGGKKSPNSLKEEPLKTIWDLPSRLMRQYVFVTTTKDEELFCYDNGKGIYLPDQEWLIKQQCRLLIPGIKTHEIQEVINTIKDSTYADREIFDSNPDVINLSNGLLNIHTLEFVEHSPEEYFLVQIPTKYDPKAKCPNILRFLGQVLKPKDVFTALELIGYCLYRSAKYEKAILCIGKGANGKTTFLKMIDSLLGSENISHVSLQDLGGDRFASAGLYGKLANTFADLKSDKLKHSGPFKMLVSGDSLRAQKKFKNPFSDKFNCWGICL